MPQRPLRVVREAKLLLVEGADDVNLLTALFKARGVVGIQVESTGGKDGLKDDLIAWTLTEGFDRLVWIGVLQDGDERPDRRFQSIAGHLRSRGLPIPIAVWQTESGLPSTLAAVVVDDTHGNDIEGVVLSALIERSPDRMRCVDEMFECSAAAASHAVPRQASKARLRAWLATHEPPSLTLGFAAQRGLLPLDHPAFDQLASILTL